MTEIKKVAVLGAGVMGSGIAAHVANAGVPVVLLDIVPKGANDRSALAKGAIDRMLKQKPAPFMHKKNARLITPGNLEDDLSALADCDWICEAVLEDPTVKHDLYKRVEDVRKDGSIVTSNTSTIPLEKLVEGQSDRFAKDFAITHFFNPPRYMRLLEVVGGKATRPGALDALRQFGEVDLGKQVVVCHDTPGFIGNRIGIYWSFVAMSQAIELGLTVEEADSIVGRPLGIPKTGIFALGDLTGIDLAPHINASMLRLLPETDAFALEFNPKDTLGTLIGGMIEKGYTGRKGKGGFYRRTNEAGEKVREALDLTTGEYRPEQKANLGSARAGRKGLRAVVEHEDKGGQYAWAVLSKVLSYTAEHAADISDSIRDVDAAMRTGYAWKWGPFEQLDMLGPKWFAEKLKADGLPVPALIEKVGDGNFYREENGVAEYFTYDGSYAAVPVPDDAWQLADRKRGAEPIMRNGSASLWDVGDGVACLELHSKMNAIDNDTVAMFAKAAQIDKQGYKALIIGGDYDNFSVGANVGVVLFAANAAMWPVVDQGIGALQDALMKLKYAKFPVVAAVAGMALGGGCEIALHADVVQAHAESYMGLVEVGVGVIPAGGGCKELVTRWMTEKKRPGGPLPALSQAFETIATAKVGTSAAESRELKFLRRSDGITMNRDRLLADAKARALSMVDGYATPEPVVLNLPGATARAAMGLAVTSLVAQGKATAYDAVVAGELGQVLSGGDTDIVDEVTEKQLLSLERQAFLTLVKKTPTLDRIEHMLETGRPLRN
ncbi:MAG: 3-hydroxyacyl-CoA dehydrogenase/enoyl-CoA hydratase family protein [Alphaproteobacteria bacterium]